MRAIEIFIQGYGLTDITVMTAEPQETIGSVLTKIEHPAAKEADVLVFLEDVDGVLDADAVVEELIPLTTADDDELNPLRLHISRCRHIEVTVRFNGATAHRRFPPGATMERVRHWAARHAFGLTARDAAEHVLQIQSTTTRPDRDIHIGTLTHHGACGVAFDLAPSKRVEG